MTRAEYKILLPVIQAFADGKVIQIAIGLEWDDLELEDILFTDGPESYRIKPEPREFWVSRARIEGNDDSFLSFYHEPKNSSDFIKFREVLE